MQTTIRVLGGLLSSYHLTRDPIYHHKALDLGNRLLSAFNTPSGLPTAMFNLQKRTAIPDVHNRNLVSTAEVATLQLELRYLAQITGRRDFWEKAEKVMKVIEGAEAPMGLAPIFLE
jgi:uncharacterized protein YyaL (SSP411 family)